MTTTPQPRPKKILVLFNHVAEVSAELDGPTIPAEALANEPQEAGFEDMPTTIIPPLAPKEAELTPVPLQEAKAICQALQDSGFHATSANLEDDVERVGHAVVVHRPAAIFNLVAGFDEDITAHAHIAGLYELYGYPYTFADPVALTTCQERARGHLMLEAGDVPVPGYATVRDVNAIPDTSDMRYPQIVTQAYDDIYEYEGLRSQVHNAEELEARIYELSTEYEMPLLIEEYIEGPRIYASLIGNRVLEVLPLIEKIADEETGGEEMRLAQLDLDTAGRIRQLARRAFRIMGCRDAAQIDFVMDDSGAVYVTDVRPMFELIPGAPFRVAAENSELGFSGVVAHIANSALARGPSDAIPEAASDAETAPVAAEPPAAPAPDPETPA